MQTLLRTHKLANAHSHTLTFSHYHTRTHSQSDMLPHRLFSDPYPPLNEVAWATTASVFVQVCDVSE